MEPLLAARHQFRRHRHRERVGQLAVDLALIEMFVLTQRPPGHRVRDERARPAAILEESAALERLVARLRQNALCA